MFAPRPAAVTDPPPPPINEPSGLILIVVFLIASGAFVRSSFTCASLVTLPSPTSPLSKEIVAELAFVNEIVPLASLARVT